MATIGKLAVEVTADASGLSRGLAGAGKETDAFESRLGGLTNKLKILGPAAIAAGTAFTIGMIKSVANTADELAKLSARTGVAVEDLSRLQFAAGLSGVSNQALTASIERLSRGMADAAAGTGEAGKAFAAMGIEVQNQDGSLKSQRDVLEEVAERFASYADGAEKSALAQQIFGRSGAQLIPLLNSGARGLKDMAKESDNLGNTISTNTAKAAERFNDNLTRMSTGLGGIARTLSGPLIESFADFTQALIDAEKNGDALKDVTEGIRKAMTGVAVILETIAVLGVNTAFVFQSIGREIGATAAQMALFAQLEFKQALSIGEELRADSIAARAEVDRLTAAILSLRQASTATDVSGAPSVNGSKPAAPQVTDEKESAAAQARATAAAAERADFENRLKALREFTMDESELTRKRHEERLAEAREAFEKGHQTEEEYNELRLALQETHEQQLMAQRTAGLEEKLDFLRDSLLTEEELLAEQHVKEMETLVAALEEKMMTEQEFMLMSQDLEMKHMDEIARIRADGLKRLGDMTKQSYQQQAQTVMSELQKMTAAGANSSRALFNINKAASIANALLSARESVVNAYRFGSRIGGPKLGAAFAATAAVATAAQVRQLSSTSFNAGASSAGAVSAGGGASAPSQSPAATLPNTAQAANGGITTVNIELQGEIFGREQVRGLISQINEAVADGSVLRFA